MNNRIANQIDNTVQKIYQKLAAAEKIGDGSVKTRITILENNITKLIEDILKENPLIFNP